MRKIGVSIDNKTSEGITIAAQRYKRTIRTWFSNRYIEMWGCLLNVVQLGVRDELGLELCQELNSSFRNAQIFSSKFHERCARYQRRIPKYTASPTAPNKNPEKRYTSQNLLIISRLTVGHEIQKVCYTRNTARDITERDEREQREIPNTGQKDGGHYGEQSCTCKDILQ